MSNSDRLVQMANDIGNFFGSLPDRAEAVAGIANHIKSYWTPKMRDRLIAAHVDGEARLDELPRAAVLSLQRGAAEPQQAPVGGDAG